MPDAPFVQGPLAIAARAGPLGAKWRAGCGTNGAPDARLWAHPGGRGGPVFGASFGARLRTKKWSPFRTKSCRPGGVKMRSCVELHYEKNPFAGPSGFRPWGQNLVRFPTPEIGPLFGPAFSVLWAPLAQGAVAEGGGRSAFGRCPFAIGRSHFLAGLP